MEQPRGPEVVPDISPRWGIRGIRRNPAVGKGVGGAPGEGRLAGESPGAEGLGVSLWASGATAMWPLWAGGLWGRSQGCPGGLNQPFSPLGSLEALSALPTQGEAGRGGPRDTQFAHSTELSFVHPQLLEELASGHVHTTEKVT